MKKSYPYFIGLALGLSLLTFTSCEQKTTEHHEERVSNTDSRTGTTRTETITDTTTTNGDTSDFTATANRESEEIKMKLEKLRERAKQKGGKASNDLSKKIDDWDNERKSFNADKTGEKMKDGWKKFKAKVEASADSLDKKI